jgi:hypothetical protein
MLGAAEWQRSTVYIKVGNSEAETELKRDARHWIKYPQPSVQICLIVKLSRAQNITTLSVWHLIDSHPPPAHSFDRDIFARQ